jgi:hypothetical protein
LKTAPELNSRPELSPTVQVQRVSYIFIHIHRSHSKASKLEQLLPSNILQLAYCRVSADPYVGLDLIDDVSGPAIWSVMSKGMPATAEPFDAREEGLPHALQGFQKSMGLYIPLYHLNSSLTEVRNPNFAGCLVTTISFHPMIGNLLAELNLQDIDVFLFWIKYGANGSSNTTYVGHFESGPEISKPNIKPVNARLLQPADIDGDIVTSFVPAFDLKLFDNTFRYVVRARKGSIVKDVHIFGAR